MRSEWEIRDEGGGASRAESRVREPQADFQKRGAEVKVACGSESRKADREWGRQVDNPAVGCSGSGPGPKAGRGVFLKGAGGPLSNEDAGLRACLPFAPSCRAGLRGLRSLLGF